MDKKKIITGTVFFMIGVTLFWFVYQNINLRSIGMALKELNYFWIIASIMLGLINSYIRALRWRMLIGSMGYRPGTLNLFLSVQILFLVNIAVPRGGEIARCGMISKYERIPFSKLLGTVFIERLTDTLSFIVVFAGVLIWKSSLIREIFSTMNLYPSSVKSKPLLILLAVFALALMFWILWKTGLLKKFQTRIRKFWHGIREGLKSIIMIEKKWMYILYTLLIIILWLMMLYVLFFSYNPTRNMTISAAIFTETVGTLAFLLPIQAGIGVWHFLAMECLHLFGLAYDSGKIFALIAHTVTNFVYLIFGTLGFIIIPLTNNDIKS